MVATLSSKGRPRHIDVDTINIGVEDDVIDVNI